jgi:hypothetical protein
MPLAKSNVRSVAGSSARGPVCPKDEMKTSAAPALSSAKTGGVALPQHASVPRLAFADDQIGRRRACPAPQDHRRHRLSVIEIFSERRRTIRIDTGDVGADIGEQTPADRGRQTIADLHHL